VTLLTPFFTTKDFVETRLERLQSRGATVTQIDKVLRDEIYPILAHQNNSLILESLIQHISKATGITHQDGIRKHIKDYSVIQEQVSKGSHNVDAGSVDMLRQSALRLAAVYRELELNNAQAAITELNQFILGATGQTVHTSQEFSSLYLFTEDEYKIVYSWVFGSQDPTSVVALVALQYVNQYITKKAETLSRQLPLATGDDKGTIESHILELSVYKQFIVKHHYANK
jgi:hypothetical protein